MNTHLSERQIENYISRTLPPSELLEMDDHLAACDACMKRTAEAKQSTTAGFQRSLFSPLYDEHHLTYEQISGYADRALSAADSEGVETHRSKCETCEQEIAELLSLRQALAADRAQLADESDRPGAPWYERAFSSTFLRIAVPSAALLIVVTFFWFAGRKPQEDIVEVTPPTTPNVEPSTTTVENGIGSVVPDNDTKITASLNDGGGRIELDSTGKVSGLSATEFEQKVRAALKDETIEVPSDLRGLKTSAGVLMGSSDSGVPLKLNGPVGKVIEPQRPTLSWQPLKDATSYKVGIYDENFKQVAVSPEIHNTSWTPSTPLKRGQIYQWQVTAIRNGEEIKSPVRPAPEAKFKVADQTSFNEIEKVRRTASNSHLLLGITYANVGLLSESEREFELLFKNNPNSEIARKLLAKVRSAR